VFQLILGISLGLILLLVVVLFITEVAATYPVWKSFSPSLSSQAHHAENGNKKKSSGLMYALLAFLIISCLAIVFLLISSAGADKQENRGVRVEKTKPPALVSTKKYLTDSLAEQGLLFTTQMKWEDGKMYCNNRVLLLGEQAPNFSDWYFSLLDKDGFLIKDFHFSQNDFVAEEAAGRTTAFLNRCQAAISLNEYQRIARLQVVLDKKINIR
jgi:flagellar basal body-associated protein FliL